MFPDTTIMTDTLTQEFTVLSENIVPEEDQCQYQKAWDEILCRYKQISILNMTDDLMKARIYASSEPESSKWLNALPSTSLGLRLDNEEFRVAACIRLGIPVAENYRCNGCDRVIQDHLSHHPLSCLSCPGKYQRHELIQDVLIKAFSSIGYGVNRQPTNLIPGDSALRPDGLTLTPWEGGRCLVYDVTVADTLAETYLGRTSRVSGGASNQAENAKRNKYSGLPARYMLTPIAFESLGVMGEDTKKFMNSIGERLKVAMREPKAKEYLLQRISIQIQRGNAHIIKAAISRGEGLQDFDEYPHKPNFNNFL
jgi:hypothetical protein